MIFILILSVILNVAFGFSVWINSQVISAMVDELIELEDLLDEVLDANGHLENQVEAQQDAMQSFHTAHPPTFAPYSAYAPRPEDTMTTVAKGPWHKPAQEDAFQLPLI